MTDITELAPAMKAAAELITSGYSRKWIVSHDDETCWVGANDDDGNLTPFIEVSIADWSGNKVDNETLARFISLCRPANILALVEALEKAQQTINEMDDRIRKQNRHVCELFDVGKALRERIAELESRTVTVKLSKPISVLHRRDFTDAHRAIYAYPEAEVNAALDGAGIKVEEE